MTDAAPRRDLAHSAPVSAATAASNPCRPPPHKAALIGRLRDSIRRIERHAPRFDARAAPRPAEADAASRPSAPPAWRLGDQSLDALLPFGLATDGLHEVKAAGRQPAAGASAGEWMAALGFAARLAARRIETGSDPGGGAGGGFIAWCWPRALAAEFGRPSAAGFARLGLDPARLLIIETARPADALDALEECLRASSLALVIGALDCLQPTPARRLSLAAGEARTPCLLVTHPGAAAAPATATRWRVAPAPSAAHPFDSRASGNARLSLSLERCRARPECAARPPLLVEWCDETRRFSLAAVVADHPAQARGAGIGAARSAVRAG